MFSKMNKNNNEKSIEAKLECENAFIKKEDIKSFKVFDELSSQGYAFGGYINENHINILRWGTVSGSNTLIPFCAMIDSKIYIPFEFRHNKISGWSNGKLVYLVKDKDMHNNQITLQGPIEILDYFIKF